MLVCYMQMEYLCTINIAQIIKNTNKSHMETIKIKTVREIIGELEVGGMVKLDGVSAGAVQASCSAMKSETREYMTKKMDGGIVVVRVK